MKTLCPICSDTLLRHLGGTRIWWFCVRCHQEMPNFDLIKFSAFSGKCRHFNNCPNNHDNAGLEIHTQNSILVIKQKLTVIDLFIDQDRERLEIVSFILNKINIIIFNTFTDTEKYIVSEKIQSNQITAQKIKSSALIKADFLRDSKIILLYICQAILVADSTVINNESLQGLKTNFSNFKLPIEQSYFVDLIKTLVIDSIHSITSDYTQNIDYFASEVASYFEMIITLMIEISLSKQGSRSNM